MCVCVCVCVRVCVNVLIKDGYTTCTWLSVDKDYLVSLLQAASLSTENEKHRKIYIIVYWIVHLKLQYTG